MLVMLIPPAVLELVHIVLEQIAFICPCVEG